MAQIKIAGIMRSGAYSPNRVGNDAAIFNAVTEQLRKRGCRVNVYTEEQLIDGDVAEDVVLNMCRRRGSVDVLQGMEDDGCLVINSGYGIENTIHSRMTRILTGSGIPFPASLIVDTDEQVVRRMVKAGIGRCWVKRGDYHAIHKEDTSFVRTPAEAQEVLKEYFLRGISTAVLSKHIDGHQMKFYGVTGSEFFHLFDADTGDPVTDAPTAAAVLKIATAAAAALDVMVYGGDAIVGDDGSITIVDINDWPSFSNCRRLGAVAIAKAVISAVRARGG